MKRMLNAGLLAVGLMIGLSANRTDAAGVTVGGTLDLTYPQVLSGGNAQEGKASVWEYDLDDQEFMLTHVHPKLSLDISDKVSGEVLVCFSEHHPASVWNAFVDYAPLESEGFGDNPVTLRAGRFFVPFGYYNNLASPVDMKTISRPLMYVDHDQEDMELHGGPRPIFMTPYPDTGLQLYGSKWLRDQTDQLWYGVYVVNGLYFNEDAFEGRSRVDIEWENEEIPMGDPNKNKQVGGRVAYSLGKLLTVGGSYLTGKYDERSTLDNTIYGADARLALGKVNLTFELAQNPVEWINKSGQEVNPEDLYTLGTEKEYTKTGWYGQVDFPFDLLFAGSTLAKKFEFATLYSVLEGSRTESANTHTFNEMSRIATALSYMPEPALKFKVEYQFTPLSDYNDTASNVSTYGDDLDDLSRVMLSAGLAF